LRLFEVPALGLFTAVVVAAQRGQVAFAGAAALVIGDGVVEVALRRGASATGSAARGGAGFDQVPEAPAGLVTRLLMAMVAAAAS
jgi:hypothetical protein